MPAQWPRPFMMAPIPAPSPWPAPIACGWRASPARLAERDIPCVIDAGPRKAKGDPREEARCGHVRTRAAAKLLADERDFTAWRSWLGLGDWLVRSDAFTELLSYARERNLTAADAFFQLAALSIDERDAVFFAKFESPSPASRSCAKTRGRHGARRQTPWAGRLRADRLQSRKLWPP